MLFRISSFLLFPLIAGAVGYLLDLWPGAAAGAVAGGLAWFLFDLWRGFRFIRWLKTGEAASAPSMAGLWGEAADRARRLLREHDHKLQESRQRLQDFLAAIQASPNGVVLLDAQGRIEWCNETAAAHLGFDARRDMLQHIGNLVRDPAFAAYMAGGDFSHDVVFPGRESTPARPVRLSLQIHPYGEGRRLLLSRDVTALEQADAMRRDFVANASHEIRTPLTVLSGFVETMQTVPLDEAERTRYLDLMAQQAGRMQTLVSDLLTLSRLEGSPPPGMGDWTPAGALLARCEQEARALSELLFPGPSGGQVLAVAPLEREFEVAGAPAEIQSALSNLISNAVRYTPAGGRIQVAWRLLPDGRAEFSVTDTGPGIAAEHIPRLTERFYRVDRSRSRESGGTGLGLAIVKHVLQRHGAELHIASKPGHGSRFEIVFPASRVRTPPSAGPARALA